MHLQQHPQQQAANLHFLKDYISQRDVTLDWFQYETTDSKIISVKDLIIIVLPRVEGFLIVGKTLAGQHITSSEIFFSKADKSINSVWNAIAKDFAPLQHSMITQGKLDILDIIDELKSIKAFIMDYITMDEDIISKKLKEKISGTCHIANTNTVYIGSQQADQEDGFIQTR